MRRTKTPTQIERLMTALYTTHYAALNAKISKIVGGAADDLIGKLAEKLLAKPDLWDGNEARVFGFLLNALTRLSFNYLRDNKKHIWDCDRSALLVSDADTMESFVVEWKAWTDPSCSPETIAIASITYEEMRALMVEGDRDQPSIYSYADVFDHLIEGNGGKELAEKRQLNINTAHGAIRRVRERIEQQQERSKGACGA
jgi:DNA-directed RNA polymerase specialized sigma24 family protein